VSDFAGGHLSSHGAGVARQFTFDREAFSVKAGALAPLDDVLFQGIVDLVRAMTGRAGLLLKGGGLTRGVATELFADGVAAEPESPGDRLDPVLSGISHQFLAKEVTIGTHAIQLEVATVHSGRSSPPRNRLVHDVRATAAAAPVPAGVSAPPAKSAQEGHDLPSFPTKCAVVAQIQFFSLPSLPGESVFRNESF